MAWSLPRLLGRLGADLVHTQYALPLRCPCPGVVTIHDLSFERDPALMGRRDRLVFRRAVPRSARRAARVLTVSERSRRDLVELYGLARGAIVVTPNGVDPVFRPGDGGARDYVLSVGAVQPRKNQLAALEAAQEVGLPLVVVGPGEGRRDSPRELRERGADAARLRRDRRARRPLPRRRVPRAGVALRGLRPARARGDGERHAGRDRAATRRCSRSPATLPSSSPRTGSRTGSGARSRDRERARRRRPRAGARCSRGARPPSARSRVYREALGR